MKPLRVMKQLVQSAGTATLLAGGQALHPASAAAPAADPALLALLEQRYQGDLSGACVMAATIEGPLVRRARYCALPNEGGLPDWNAAFEIGSITKTMTAYLVSDLIAKGRWSLDDPIAQHLPKGTTVPRQGERQILVRDLLTHSAGLPSIPSRMWIGNPQDPWADLTENDLLASLSNVSFSAPIGTNIAYSNFGMALVSLAVSRAYGTDYETAIRTALFEPLGMQGAYLYKPPLGTVVAEGHKAPGERVPAWTVSVNLAGIGLVRATLDDLVRYTQAHLGLLPTPLYARLKATQTPLLRNMGMNWMGVSMQGHDYVMHNGGTGGFRSALYMEPSKQRAVILLSNTSYDEGGELDATALALLNPDVSMLKARTAMASSAEALQHMPGNYRVAGLDYTVSRSDQELRISTPGRASQTLQMDSRGDFHAFGAVLSPEGLNSTVNRIAITRDGERLEGLRVGYTPRYKISNPLWKAWAGEYQLQPDFTLKVFEEDQRLYVQGTGQKPIEVTVSAVDQLQAPKIDVIIDLTRNSDGKVAGLTLRQRGNTIYAVRLL